MLVRDRMTRHPVTITANTPVTEALNFMRQNHIRRLPVLDQEGQLVGIVSEKDLLYAAPSSEGNLSVYEVSRLLSKLKVENVMTREIITVQEDTFLEEAARTMVDHRIGGLPVMRNGNLIGIITETDLFKVFLEILGGHEQGLRVCVSLPKNQRALETLVSKVNHLGGNIVSMGTFYGEDCDHGCITMKVRGVSREKLLQGLGQIQVKVVDVRGHGYGY